MVPESTLSKEKLKRKFNVRGVDIYLKPAVNICKIENIYDILKLITERNRQIKCEILG